MISDVENRKRRNAISFILLELVLSSAEFAVALTAYLLVSNNSSGCFWAPVPLAVACVLMFVGVAQKANGNGWMMAGIVFNAIGGILVFIACIIDAVQAGYISNTDFNQCTYTSTASINYCYGSGVIFTVNSHCPITLKPDSCYCCYIFRSHNCDDFGFSLSSQPDTFEGVDSCETVENKFQALLWSAMALGLLNFVTTIITCSMVTTYKNHFNTVSPGFSRATPATTAPIFRTQVMSADRPIHIWSAQNGTVGYHPRGPPVLLKPPDYSSIVGHQLPQATPNMARRGTVGVNGMTPTETPFHDPRKPYGNISPPPYAP